MRVKTEQMIYLGLAFLFTGAFMWFLKMPGIVTAVAAAFVFITGAFLGIDLAQMVKKTAGMPKGEFDPVDKWRYIVSLVFLGILTGEAFAISQLFERDMSGVYGSVGVGTMVILGLLISGIEANKVVTDNGPAEME
jgi:hypothetical protein